MEDNSAIDLSETVLPQQDREQQLEDEMVALRQEKARTKTLFTKARRCLLVLLQERDVSVETIQSSCERVDGVLETVMDTMISLTDKYREVRDRNYTNKVCQEIETVEIEYSAAQSQAQEVITELNRLANLNNFVRQIENLQLRDAPELLVSSSHGQQVKGCKYTPGHSEFQREYNAGISASSSSLSSSQRGTQLLDDSQNNTSSMFIGQDLWKQLKRVSVFWGQKVIPELESCVYDMCRSSTSHARVQIASVTTVFDWGSTEIN